MLTLFGVVLMIVIGQRFAELRLARKNRAYILAQGGYEAGASHYKYIVLLHLLFFLSLIAEVLNGPRQLADWWWLPFTLFLLAQGGRYWCIRTLGRHWNTRIMILPGAALIRRGPYRFMRHPNYWIVTLELFTLPLSFRAYVTALSFPLANLLLLGMIRIPQEEQALRSLLSQDADAGNRLNEDSPD